MKLLGLFSLLLVLLASCKTYSDEEINDFDKQIKDYLKKEGIQCEKTESGLYYKIIEQGEGNFIKFQDIVIFSYKGYFLNGKVFDEQKEPVEFPVQKLILAWKEIMFEVKPGAKFFLVTPPQLAYGSHELDDIPPNSILVYEMEIHSVK